MFKATSGCAATLYLREHSESIGQDPKYIFGGSYPPEYMVIINMFVSGEGSPRNMLHI